MQNVFWTILTVWISSQKVNSGLVQDSPKIIHRGLQEIIEEDEESKIEEVIATPGSNFSLSCLSKHFQVKFESTAEAFDDSVTQAKDLNLFSRSCANYFDYRQRDLASSRTSPEIVHSFLKA